MQVLGQRRLRLAVAVERRLRQRRRRAAHLHTQQQQDHKGVISHLILFHVAQCTKAHLKFETHNVIGLHSDVRQRVSSFMSVSYFRQ